jgi:hypothetical protein
MTHSPLDDEIAAFLESPVAIDVAACSSDGRPSSTRAFGAFVAPGSNRLRVYVSRREGRRFLEDAQRGGPVAAVFCRPLTHAAIQLKGREVELAMMTAADVEVVAAHRRRFVESFAALGFRRELVDSYLRSVETDLAALEFTVESIFEQTPGPKAGVTRMEPSR